MYKFTVLAIFIRTNIWKTTSLCAFSLIILSFYPIESYYRNDVIHHKFIRFSKDLSSRFLFSPFDHPSNLSELEKFNPSSSFTQTRDHPLESSKRFSWNLYLFFFFRLVEGKNDAIQVDSFLEGRIGEEIPRKNSPVPGELCHTEWIMGIVTEG